MSVLGILVSGSIDVGGLRPLLLIMLILAVLLLIAGSVIALWTFRNQRKDRLALVTLEQLDSEMA